MRFQNERKKRFTVVLVSTLATQHITTAHLRDLAENVDPPMWTSGITHCSEDSPCGRCEGDCDKDSDCMTGLRCFQRDGYEKTPGCERGGFGDVYGFDYCYNPGHNPARLFDIEGGCSANNICGACSGDCSTDADCIGNLKCFLTPKDPDSGPSFDFFDFFGHDHYDKYDHDEDKDRDGDKDKDEDEDEDKYERFEFDSYEFSHDEDDNDDRVERAPGCKAGGEGDIDENNYCYDPQWSLPELVYFGDEGCFDGNCGECQGDCDKDSDCEGRLKCFDRNRTNIVVPGCKQGGGGDIQDYDYCYDPHNVLKLLKNKGEEGCSPGRPCGRCQGDCDYDSDCKDDLICYWRNGRDGTPPGCQTGGVGDVASYDYCYDPKWNQLELTHGGIFSCSSKTPCEKCEGDCDKDADCKGDLKCFKRDKFEFVPGCKPGGMADIYGHDYCYDPNA